MKLKHFMTICSKHLPGLLAQAPDLWLPCRIREHVQAVLTGHDQEVCGLKWSPNGQQLASGGNDNLLNVWAQGSATGQAPSHSLAAHTAAVKALAWCPFQSSLLASGGGTADRTIRFWNTHTGCQLNSIDTESQVQPQHLRVLLLPRVLVHAARKGLQGTTRPGLCCAHGGPACCTRSRAACRLVEDVCTRSVMHLCRCAPCSGTPTSVRSSAPTGSARTSCACGSTPPWPRLASSPATLLAFFTWHGCVACPQYSYLLQS